MAILNAAALELVQEAVTAANADILAGTYDGLRLALEDILVLLAYASNSGSLTSDPPNDTSGVLTDSGAGFSTDAHNGRQVVICSGGAMGNIYTIADTTIATLVVSGVNLYADGLRAGDAYKVLYQFTSCAAHLHDGINGALVNAQDSILAFHQVAGGSGDNTNTSGTSGPTGYSYTRLMAWKVGRGGAYMTRISAKATDGSLSMSGIMAVNGSPVGSHLSQLVSNGQTYTFNTQSTGQISAGDVIEFYANTGASYAGTWTVELMTGNPAFSAAPKYSEYL